MLIILSIIYFLIVAGDVWITLWAAKNGKAKEGNIILIPFVEEPPLFIGVEALLYVIVVWASIALSPYVLIPAIWWRVMILLHNIHIVRGKQ